MIYSFFQIYKVTNAIHIKVYYHTLRIKFSNLLYHFYAGTQAFGAWACGDTGPGDYVTGCPGVTERQGS